MKKLPLPAITAMNVACAEATRVRQPLKTKLTDSAVLACLQAAESNYDSLLKTGDASHVKQSTNIAGVVTQDEAIKVYSDLGKIEVNGKNVRGSLLLSNMGEKCAYCAMDRARTLDHYLPKRKYVELAFMPKNLIPCCQSCNGVAAKGEFCPTSKADAIIHPYYEDTNDARWLSVTIGIDNVHGLLPSYSVVRPSSWGNDKFSRVKKTFEILELSAAYASDLIAKINDTRGALASVFNKSGGDGISKFFAEWAMHESERGGLNNWLQIGFECIAKDISLCKNYDKWLHA